MNRPSSFADGSVRESIEEVGVDRRLGLVLILLLLVLVGSGVGTFVFTQPTDPPAGNETTPTPTETDTPAVPTVSPGTDTQAATPTDRATPTTPEDPDETPTDEDDDDEDDDDPIRGGGPTTPSPGLEITDGDRLLAVDNLAPGQSGSGTLGVRNAESEDGNLSISSVNVTDVENGVTEPESEVDTTAGGELSSHLEVRIAVREASGDERFIVGDDDYVRLSTLRSRLPSAEYSLESGEEVTLVAYWRLPDSTGNVVQSDGVTVDLGLLMESVDD